MRGRKGGLIGVGIALLLVLKVEKRIRLLSSGS
jgi:hypothetical protein